MSQRIEYDDESGDYVIRIRGGHTKHDKSRAVGDLIRAMDRQPSSGPTPTLPEPSAGVLPNSGVSSDASEQGSADDGEVLDGLGREASGDGESLAHTDGDGETSDEDDTRQQDIPQIEASGDHVEQATDDGVLEESEEQGREHDNFVFHFAPGEYSN